MALEQGHTATVPTAGIGPVTGPGPARDRLIPVRPFWKPLLLALLTAALAMLVVGTMEWSYRKAMTSLAKAGQRDDTRRAAETLLRRLIDAETAQRGFLLTGRESYLAPYDNADRDVDAALAVLRSSAADQPAQGRLVESVAQDSHARLTELRLTLDAYRSGDEAAWQDTLDSDVGKARMEAVRHSVAVLLNHAQQAADLEQSRIADTLDLGRRTVHLTTLLAIIGLLFYLRQNHAMQGAQVRHSEELARERDHLEQVVQRRTEELARLNLHLQTLREGERGRFARTLHDDLGAALAAAKMDLTRLRKSGAILDKAWLERLQHLDQEISDSISIKRRIMEELMPPALHNLGLRPALELLADDIRTRSPVRLQLQVDDIEAGEACRNAVYRVVQEALSNVLQHAKATQVFARVTAGEQAVRILVRDNGAGFDRDVLTRQGRSLLQLRYRVELVGGSFHVETSPGHGTEIRASVPLVQ